MSDDQPDQVERAAAQAKAAISTIASTWSELAPVFAAVASDLRRALERIAEEAPDDEQGTHQRSRTQSGEAGEEV